VSPRPFRCEYAEGSHALASLSCVCLDANLVLAFSLPHIVAACLEPMHYRSSVSQARKERGEGRRRRGLSWFGERVGAEGEARGGANSDGMWRWTRGIGEEWIEKRSVK